MQGLGTIDSPYIITQPSDFEHIRTNLNAYYELGNDIDFTGEDFTAIGYSTTGKRFNGKFDGKGYTIKNVNVVAGTQSNQVGFFGYTDTECSIQNVKFDNLSMTFVGTTANYTYGLIASVAMGEFKNIHLHGVMNISGYVGRVGAFAGLSYETVERFKAHNIYINVEMNFSNSIPYTGSNKNIGGFMGQIANDNTTPSPNISNIVVNNKLTISNPSVFTIGRVVGSRNYQTTYNNVYANISHFDNNYTENFGIVTDSSILSPLSLDAEYWIHEEGNPPQLKSFIRPLGNQRKETTVINFKMPSVTYKRSKRKSNSSLPVKVTSAYFTLNKRLNTTCKIVTNPLIVSSYISNANIKSHTFTIKASPISVERLISKCVLRYVAIDLSDFKVNLDIVYPKIPNYPIFALIYVIDNPTNVNSLHGQSVTYAIENKSRIEVI